MTDKIETFPDFLRALADGPVYFVNPFGGAHCFIGVKLTGLKLIMFRQDGSCDDLAPGDIGEFWHANYGIRDGFTRTPRPRRRVPSFRYRTRCRCCAQCFDGCFRRNADARMG
jgi:hypothetical protein